MAQFRRNHLGAGNTGSALVRMLLILGGLLVLLALLFILGANDWLPGPPGPGKVGYEGPDDWFAPKPCSGQAVEGDAYLLCLGAEGKKKLWVAYFVDGEKLDSGWIPPRPWSLPGRFWGRLEEQVRAWCRQRGRIYVTQGPLLPAPDAGSEQGLQGSQGSEQGSQGTGQGSAPEDERFFLALLHLGEPEAGGIAFVASARETDKNLLALATPIDSVEASSGLDLFPELMTPELESRLEGAIDTGRWPLTAK